MIGIEIELVKVKVIIEIELVKVKVIIEIEHEFNTWVYHELMKLIKENKVLIIN
ncbi:hypothetical protein J5751_06260 [bacterium]|nr:hypothetical protein [bacterium]